ncbi:MAG TPA: alpha-hydroxy acid oxidase [Candidatus Kapabacteria bacterium]|jgi:L-lactate dehydrogenase (cytochrome)|nr:alpha-hydroxy acid oxidase [Candidatus Kapabacteria bacterium]
MDITNIADLQQAAKSRLPRTVYTYFHNGGYEEETLRRNRRDLESVALVPRVLNDVSNRSLAADMAGTPGAMPVGLAPVGACGLAYPNGEVEAALAAKECGVPFCLSTLSIATIEDVAEATRAPFWFQLYLMKDKSVGEALVERAKRAGCSTLVLSMDLHVRSQRHGEQKRGLGAPPRIDLTNIFDVLTHLRWLISMIGSKRRTFGNLVGLVKNAKRVAHITRWLEEQFDPTLSVKDIEWARMRWPGKLLVKGVMHPEDARECIEHGADGVIVSNHGGRQVDGAISTMSTLPSVVEAVAGRGYVLVDSGIRSGIDVLKMMALGANGCLIGRAYLYGLAAKGREGVKQALTIIRNELDQNMALCGARDITRLPSDLLSRQEDSKWQFDWEAGQQSRL